MKLDKLTEQERLKVLHKRRLLREDITGMLMASGPFIGYLIFSLFPMVLSLFLSFTDLYGFDLFSATWTGFDNYLRVFKMDMFYTAIGNTLHYCLNVPLNLVISLYLANLLTKQLKGTKFVRTILFIPAVCSGVAVTLMWSWIFDYQFGALNVGLKSIGLPAVGWISTEEMFMNSALVITMWMYGTNIVMMQTALANVDQSLKEAARIDGASERRVFFSVTLPGVTPTLFYLLVTHLVRALSEVGLMQIITNNGLGPGFKAVTLSYFMYRMGFVNIATEGLGLASALSWIMAIGLIIITRINFWLSTKWVTYD